MRLIENLTVASLERFLTEPRKWDVFITCGSATIAQVFTVNQPVSLAQPIQKGWEYMFESSNLESVMFLATFVGLGILCIFFVALAIKRGKSYAR